MKFTFLQYLTEDVSSELVVIYPGRFQPAHKNHAKVYKYLKEKFPHASVFISTSNKLHLPDSPFTFEEKKIMLTAAGVPQQNIIQTVNPYVAAEIVRQFDKDTSKLIFAVGGKDMETAEGKKPRFNFLPTKKGDAYFKPLQNIKNIKPKDIQNLVPFSQHGYVAATPTFTFSLKLGGHNIQIKGASQIRELYRNASESGRSEIVTQLYGNFNEEIYNIFNQRLL